ncbi:hypothetical protein Peur_034542 [Populus x canadensis]
MRQALILAINDLAEQFRSVAGRAWLENSFGLSECLLQPIISAPSLLLLFFLSAGHSSSKNCLYGCKHITPACWQHNGCHQITNTAAAFTMPPPPPATLVHFVEHSNIYVQSR